MARGWKGEEANWGAHHSLPFPRFFHPKVLSESAIVSGFKHWFTKAEKGIRILSSANIAKGHETLGGTSRPWELSVICERSAIAAEGPDGADLRLVNLIYWQDPIQRLKESKVADVTQGGKTSRRRVCPFRPQTPKRQFGFLWRPATPGLRLQPYVTCWGSKGRRVVGCFALVCFRVGYRVRLDSGVPVYPAFTSPSLIIPEEIIHPAIGIRMERGRKGFRSFQTQVPDDILSLMSMWQRALARLQEDQSVLASTRHTGSRADVWTSYLLH